MHRWFAPIAVTVSLALAIVSAIPWYQGRYHPIRYLARMELEGNVAKQHGYSFTIEPRRLVVDRRVVTMRLSASEQISLDRIMLYPGAVAPEPHGRWHWVRDQILWAPSPDSGLPSGPLARLGFRHFAPRRDWDLPIMDAVLAHRERYRVVAVPYWALVLGFSMPAILWIWHERARRRRQRILAGLCMHCGYDLRATPDRCPECGTDARGASVQNRA